MPKKAVLLLNVGSPDSPKPEDVARYLKQFLMDPDIISLPWILRAPLVHGVIVPRRHQSSAEKYHKIWTEEGSPLVVLTRKLQKQLQESLGDEFVIEMAMSFGNPTLERALKSLKQREVSDILVCPLFPQYAEATTGSCLKSVTKTLKKIKWEVNWKSLDPFYKEEFFLSAFERQLRQHDLDSYEQIVFSFHGLPESQIRKTNGCLVSEACCEQSQACASNCYRAQCFSTAQELARKLEIPQSKWKVSFQSRLGRAKWIGPSTDETTKQLAASGVKKILIACPSFVTDCLETLEEIGIGLKEDFLAAGGQQLVLTQCPNADTTWTQDFAKHIQTQSRS